MNPALLGVMELETNSYEWKDIGSLFLTWLQDAGGFAALGLFCWTLYVMASPAPAVAGARRQLISRLMAVCGGLALVAYLIAFGLTVSIYFAEQDFAEQRGFANRPVNPNAPVPVRPPDKLDEAQSKALAVGGLFALLAFCEPFVLDLARWRWRRIYAIARLSFKEAVRRRVVWVFLIFLLVFLFPATWFFFKRVKPEDMLKTTISVVAFAMTVLLTGTALLLSAFSIPTDVKNQTIHTIVTKPVERFEIVAGRFLGFVALETIALFILTAVSLGFILTSNVDPAARAESMKARVPVYGHLNYVREREEEKRLQSQAFAGIDVGREYAYRKYIAGGFRSSHRAVWIFSNKSQLRELSQMPAVPLEFAFDIYRTTKGQENKGVFCTFDVVTWKWDPGNEEKYKQAINAAFGDFRNIRAYDENAPAETLKADWDKANAIAEKFGRFEFKSFPVYDYHTYSFMVPPGLIKNALEGDPEKDARWQAPGGPGRVMVKVKCESESQLIGVAPLDLYFMESEGSFELNFFKGAIGLWCRLTIVIGLAVAASTYLSGVVSFLLALVLFLAGYFQEFLHTLAVGTNIGGGPFESFNRLVKGVTTAAELDKTPAVQVSLFADRVFRWGMRRAFNVLPDTDRFTWSNYLEQGFNIGFDFIGLNLLFLAGYLLPWAVMAYYLMRSREVAA
jgi:hypothetical protein